MSDHRDSQGRQTHPDFADQFKHITSRLGKPPSEEAFNNRDEGSAQIRQTYESLKQKIKNALHL